MTTHELKKFTVRVTIMGHCKEDVIERIQDYTENPIDNFIDQSIEEIID